MRWSTCALVFALGCGPVQAEPDAADYKVEQVIPPGAARERARHRFVDQPWATNAEVPGPALRSTHPVHADGRAMVLDEVGRGRLTARGMDRVLRVAWTLADLGGVDRPGAAEVSAAVMLRGGGLPWAA